jgi:hypothetical protein
MELIVMIWALQAGVAAVLSFPIVLLARRRVHWYSWELLAFVLPFCAWFALQYFWPTPSSAKGISNAFNEPVYIGLAVPVVALIRVLGGRGREADERMLAAILLLALCGVAAIVFFVTPNLGGTFG